jgi:hypothetical protein
MVLHSSVVLPDPRAETRFSASTSSGFRTRRLAGAMVSFLPGIEVSPSVSRSSASPGTETPAAPWPRWWWSCAVACTCGDGGGAVSYGGGGKAVVQRGVEISKASSIAPRRAAPVAAFEIAQKRMQPLPTGGRVFESGFRQRFRREGQSGTAGCFGGKLLVDDGGDRVEGRPRGPRRLAGSRGRARSAGLKLRGSRSTTSVTDLPRRSACNGRRAAATSVGRGPGVIEAAEKVIARGRR